MGTAFAASADFAVDKPAGTPCRHLRTDLRCGIHSLLRESGFRGCAVYDCFGAGQQLSQVTFAGRDWRDDPATAEGMFTLLPVMRQLHELLWYLAQARELPAAAELHPELDRAARAVDALTGQPEASLLTLDVEARRRPVAILLRRASALARAASAPGGRDLAGADLAGADLREVSLAGADLRGSTLIGADLRGADLRYADLLGADLRGALLDGADLTGALYLTSSQLEAATR